MTSFVSVRIKSKSGSPLNEVADYFFENYAGLADKLEKIELVEGKSTIFGDDDAPIKTMIFTASLKLPKTQEELDEAIAELEKHFEIEKVISEKE